MTTKESGLCLPGISDAQARANEQLLRDSHARMRCDDVPGVAFPPAAYADELAGIAPPLGYGARLTAPLSSLSQVPKSYARAYRAAGDASASTAN